MRSEVHFAVSQSAISAPRRHLEAGNPHSTSLGKHLSKTFTEGLLGKEEVPPQQGSYTIFWFVCHAFCLLSLIFKDFCAILCHTTPLYMTRWSSPLSIQNPLTSGDWKFGALSPLRSNRFMSWSQANCMRSRWCCREGSQASEAVDGMHLHRDWAEKELLHLCLCIAISMTIMA